MKDNGKEWRRSIYQKKERAKQDLAMRRARKQAEHYLRYLQLVEFPGKSLIQLLYVIVNSGQWLAGEMAVEQIELNQKLFGEDRKFLQRIKTQLAERAVRKDYPVRS